MAGGCGERMRTGTAGRLRCLTIARCVAATVVAALAVTVVLMVLIVGLAPEHLSVSVNHGHFQVAQTMWSVDDFDLQHYPYDHDNETLPEFDPRNYTLAVYRPANFVAIWVSMNFDVPGGGGVNATCNITAVSVFDMPNAPSFLGMVRIAVLNVGKEICRTYHGALDRWIPIDDGRTLDYIARRYGGMSEFTALIQVDTTVNDTRRGKDPENATHYCWPVIIGHRRSITAEAVTCRPSRGIDYTAGAGSMAPPPPPPLSSPPPPRICEVCVQEPPPPPPA